MNEDKQMDAIKAAFDTLSEVFSGMSERIRQVEEALAIIPRPCNPFFLKRVDALELSMRSENCLKSGIYSGWDKNGPLYQPIEYVGDLIQKSEADMLGTPNFGRKSLNEVKGVLAEMGLKIGMDAPGWPPANFEALAKRFQEQEEKRQKEENEAWHKEYMARRIEEQESAKAKKEQKAAQSKGSPLTDEIIAGWPE